MVQGRGQPSTKVRSVLNSGYVWLHRVMKSQHFFGNLTLLRERSHGRQIGVLLILIHAVCSILEEFGLSTRGGLRFAG